MDNYFYSIYFLTWDWIFEYRAINFGYPFVIVIIIEQLQDEENQ